MTPSWITIVWAVLLALSLLEPRLLILAGLVLLVDIFTAKCAGERWWRGGERW